MSLSDIIQKILDDAHEEAACLHAKAKKDVERIHTDCEKRSADLLQSLEEKTKKKADQMQKKVEGLIIHQKKKGLLEMKRRQVSSAFLRAKEEIRNLPSSEKEKILISIFLQIDVNEGIVYSVSGDEKIIESAMKKAKKNFRFGSSIKGIGGFMLVTPDFEVDFRFNSIIDRELVLKLERDVLNILFSE